VSNAKVVVLRGRSSILIPIDGAQA
jgi:hypothetical protein